MSDVLEQKQKNEESLKVTLVSFAYELGISIVAPLIIFVILGIWFDKKFDTKPIGVIACLLLSLIPTTLALTKKIRKFNQ